jgi:hypothetical protein
MTDWMLNLEGKALFETKIMKDEGRPKHEETLAPRPISLNPQSQR